MEERVKTSFIPKASLAVERKQVKAGGQVALANLIAGVILVLAILASAGVFLFERFTVQNIAAKQTSLDRSRDAFEPATIKELSRLNTRIETGKTLLGNHIAVSRLFQELEALTLTSVRFKAFSYDAGASTDHGLLKATGSAVSFNAVALQSGAFSKSAIITDPIFSDVNLGGNGAIEFDFSAVIDLNALIYSGQYAGQGVPVSEPVTEPASSTPPLPQN